MIGRTSSMPPRCGAAANMPDRACSPFSSAAQCGCTGRPAAAAAVFWRAVAAHGAQPTGLAHPWLCGYVAAIAAYGIRLGIAAAIGLMLIGGRLVLSFTTTTWCQTIRVGCRADFARPMHSRWASSCPLSRKANMQQTCPTRASWASRQPSARQQLLAGSYVV